MSTWSDVKAHLASHYQLAVDEPGWVGMVWKFTYRGAVIAPRVKVTRIAAEGGARERIHVLAAVCRASRINASGALRFNARLEMGALVVERGHCYLRVVLALETLDLRDLDRAIAMVARETARLRDPKPVGGHLGLFTPYED